MWNQQASVGRTHVLDSTSGLPCPRPVESSANAIYDTMGHVITGIETETD